MAAESSWSLRLTPKKTAKWLRKRCLFISLLLLVVLAVLVQSVVYLLIHEEAKLPLRIIKPVKYTGFDKYQNDPDLHTVSIKTVYHVTKEFGPAVLGGLGSVVTTLTSHQIKQGLNVQIVLPAYSYLRNASGIEQREPIQINIVKNHWHLWRNRAQDSTHLQKRTVLTISVFRLQYEGATVHLLGPGDLSPFNLAFQAKSRTNIYAETPGLGWETRDFLYNMATAEFLKREHSIQPIDIVHLHGATHAFVLPVIYSLGMKFDDPMRPAFVYTVHDYSDEFEYKISEQALDPFIVPPLTDDTFATEVVDQQVYSSAYGVRGADVVTCVSHNMALEIADGAHDMMNSMLIIGAFQAKIRENKFFGISNGVDFDNFNPFINRKLILFGLNFDLKKSIIDVKSAAKRHLIKHGILPSDAETKPLVLYVGRFQAQKGFSMCLELTTLIASAGIAFVVMGQHTETSSRTAWYIQRNGGIIIDKDEVQEEIGLIVRAAADIVFVPSRFEAFGLVAAEGLAMGSLVVSTGVGGLRDFLIDRNSPVGGFHNAYFFSFSHKKSLEIAINQCVEFLKKMSPNERDIYVRKIVTDALKMSWGAEDGPLSKYLLVYQIASTIVKNNQITS